MTCFYHVNKDFLRLQNSGSNTLILYGAMNIYQNNMPSVMALQRHAANLFHVSKFKQK